MFKLILSMMLILVANASPDAHARPHPRQGRAAKLKNSGNTNHFKRADLQRYFSQQHRITSKYRSMFMRPNQNYQELLTQYKTKNDEIMKNIEHTIDTPSK